jgi:predicted RNA-binding Zn ribbon-like protein
MPEPLQAVLLPTRLGGNLALDFVNTAEFRDSARRVEFLHAYTDLLAWCWRAGALPDEEAGRLYGLAVSQAEAAAAAFRRALDLREALYSLFAACVNHAPMPDLTPINAALERMQRRLLAVPGGVVWSWGGQADDLERVLWPLVQAGAELLTSDQVGWLRQCPNCGWLFIDTSRNHTRRWCSMDYCGSEVKSRRQYARKQAQREVVRERR